MVNDIAKNSLSLVSDVSEQPKFSSVPQQQSDSNPGKEQINTEVSSKVLEYTANRLNQAVQSIERGLQFTVDEQSGETIITVTDKKTDEVIRQIPSEEVLAIRENIESLKGILFSAEV